MLFMAIFRRNQISSVRGERVSECYRAGMNMVNTELPLLVYVCNSIPNWRCMWWCWEVHWEGRLYLSNGIVMKFLISEPSQSITKKPAQFWIEIYQLRQLRIGIVLQYQTQHWSTQDVDSKPQGPSCTMNRYNESYSFLALLCNEM